MITREARAALWKTRRALLAKIRAAVAAEYGIEVADLDDRCRLSPGPEARAEVMARLWECGLSLSEVGRLVGRDPSTVCVSVRKTMGNLYTILSPGPGRARGVDKGARQ